MSKVERSNVFSSLLGNLGDLKVGQQEIALAEVDFNPSQPRKYLDPEALDTLAASIKERGVLEPILVRPVGKRFEVVAGERRTRAAKAAGLKTIPAVVKEIAGDDVLEIAIIENLQREDLNPVEETDGILQILSKRLNKPVEEVIDSLRNLYDEARGRVGNTGISKTEKHQIEGLFKTLGRFSVSSFYTNRIPILSLPLELLEVVRQGELNYTKAKLLTRVKDEKERLKLLKETLKKNLSREDLEQRLSSEKTTPANDLVSNVKRSLTLKRLEKLDKGKRKQIEKLLSEIEKLLR
jgi:ParB family chromosome partitioning protein